MTTDNPMGFPENYESVVITEGDPFYTYDFKFPDSGSLSYTTLPYLTADEAWAAVTGRVPE
jgi:hypothetical protein